MLENLTILLDDEQQVSTSTIANLPTNEDVMHSLHTTDTGTVDKDNADSNKRLKIQINELCVVW